MNPNTTFRDARPHPLKQEEVATGAACQRKFDLGSSVPLGIDYTGFNGYLEALGLPTEAREKICEAFRANLGHPSTADDCITPLEWLSREVNSLSEDHHYVQGGCEKKGDSTEAFLEWRLQVWLAQDSRLQSELFSTDVGEIDLNTMQLAPTIERTTMSTACLERGFLRRSAVLILERLSTVRALAVQTYRRLLVGA